MSIRIKGFRKTLLGIAISASILGYTGVSATLLYVNQSSNPEGIYRLNLDGTNFQTVIPGPGLSRNAGRAIAVNPDDGKMYYTQTGRGILRDCLSESFTVLCK